MEDENKSSQSVEVKDLKEKKHSRKSKHKKGSTFNKDKGRYADKVNSGFGNDSKWYTKFPVVAKGVGNLPWYFRQGETLGNLGEGTKSITLPSVLLYPYVPTPGYTALPSDAFNQIARTTWLTLHRKYRGLGTYEQADLGIAMYAILDCFTSLAKMERIYGVLNYYTSRNLAIPVGILSAMGFQADRAGYIGTKLAEFRANINQLILKAKQLCLPKGMTLLDKEVRMNSMIFKDSKSFRANIYLFDKCGYWLWTPTTFKTGSGLTFVQYSRTENPDIYVTLDSLYQDLQTQMEALLSDSDINRMCSDVIAAIGTENIVSAQLIPENYFVEPVYDESWNVEIHNGIVIPVSGFAKIGTNVVGLTNNRFSKNVFDGVPNATNNIYLHIWQENNVIQFRPYIGANKAEGTMDYVALIETSDAYYIASSPTSYTGQRCLIPSKRVLFDTWEEEPAFDEIIEMAQFSVGGDHKNITVTDTASKSRNIIGTDLNCVGTEIMLLPRVVKMNGGFGTLSTLPPTVLSSLSMAGIGADAFAGILTKFDWHPLYYIDSAFNETNFGEYNGSDYILGDLDNPIMVNMNDLKHIHNVSNLSLLSNVLSDEILHE